MHLQDSSRKEASTSLDQGLKVKVKDALVKPKETRALKALEEDETEISKIESNNSTDEEISLMFEKFK